MSRRPDPLKSKAAATAADLLATKALLLAVAQQCPGQRKLLRDFGDIAERLVVSAINSRAQDAYLRHLEDSIARFTADLG